MTTLLQAVNAIVTFEDPKDYGYEETNLYAIFMAEKGNWQGFSQKSVTDWVQGLPSIVNFPYMDYDILSALEGQGIMRKTELGQSNLISKYWQTLGQLLYKIMQTIGR